MTNEDTCPITPLVSILGAKWTVEIMRELSIQPTRTRRFLLHIPALSMKCLRQRLKELENLGVIKRVEYNERVPRVEYSLTDRGRKLAKILEQIKVLAEEMEEPVCKCPVEQDCSIETMACHRRRQGKSRGGS